MGGPPVLLVARPDGLVVVDESKLKRPGRRQQAERLLAVPPGVQPVPADRFRPPSLRRQLSQARRLGDPTAIVDDAQRPIRGGRSGPLRRPRRLAIAADERRARSDARSRLLWAARPTTRRSTAARPTWRSSATPSKRQAIPTATRTARRSSSCATPSSTRASSCTRNDEWFHHQDSTPQRKRQRIERYTKEADENENLACKVLTLLLFLPDLLGDLFR